jgi:serine/threonine protein kinase
VTLVRSKRNGQYFAMKEINLKQSILKSSIINRSYALDEGLKLRQLNATQHRNIIKYYKSYLYDECIYWIMEYCDGGTLRDRICLYAKSDKKISEDLIWYWSLHILNGIKYIHNKGIIHRDLKPDNVYIESKRGVCKIGDFGFAKILVETSITANTSIKYLKFDENDDVNNRKVSKSRVLVSKPSKRSDEIDNIDEQNIAYKFINMSQVGTPSYIAPELRMLIESHLTFCSVETINKSIELCEKTVYKGDIFSFGCLLYELVHLRAAFENKFLLPNDNHDKILNDIDQDQSLANYSSDIKALMKYCLEKNAHHRPNIKQIFNLDLIKSRLNIDYLEAYKMQVIPRLIINKKNGPLEYLKVKLDNFYKPISMKSLKFNQNLIVVLAHKQLSNSVPKYKILTSTLNNLSPFGQKEEILINENNLGNIILKENSSTPTTAPLSGMKTNLVVDESEMDQDMDIKFLIYNEYGELLNEINSFVHEQQQQQHTAPLNPNIEGYQQPMQRHLLNFKVNDFLIDEEYDHLYLTTKKYGILRFKIVENNFYMEDLVFDGRIDLSELYDEQNRIFKCNPTCMSLVENETVFKDSIKTTGN